MTIRIRKSRPDDAPALADVFVLYLLQFPNDVVRALPESLVTGGCPH